jgi:SAM-dependent methyltransferase
VYEALWSPVILPPAARLVPRVVRPGQRLVVDIGTGTGALLGAIAATAPGVRIAALDASAGMLRLARGRGGAVSVLGDALALPLANAAADAVLLLYVLFHLPDPSAAVAEATRVLRPGGRAGTITWAWERDPPAAMVWDKILAASGVPSARLRRVDSGLDRADSVAALLRSAGLEPERVWTERLGRQWDRAAFAALASGSGPARLRLSRLDPSARADALVRLHDSLARLPAADFVWEGEVICAVAVRQSRLSGQASARGDTPGMSRRPLAAQIGAQDRGWRRCRRRSSSHAYPACRGADLAWARVTRPRSAATKPKERPSAKSDMTQTARPASCRPSPATTPPVRMGAGGPEQDAGECPAERQQPASGIAADGGRRPSDQESITNHACSTRKAAPMRLCVRR